MHIHSIFNIEDISNIILTMLNKNCNDIRNVSRDFKDIFTKFINNQFKSKDFNDGLYNNLHDDLYDIEQVKIIAKYKFIMKHEPNLSLFYINNYILTIIENIYYDEWKNTINTMNQLKAVRKQRNLKCSRGNESVKDNLYDLIKSKSNYLKVLEPKKTKIYYKLKENFKTLENTKDPNYGILKLASMLGDIKILELINITDIDLLQKCNKLYFYLDNIYHNECLLILKNLQWYLYNKREPCTCGSVNHTQKCLMDDEFAHEDFNYIYEKMRNYKR